MATRERNKNNKKKGIIPELNTVEDEFKKVSHPEPSLIEILKKKTFPLAVYFCPLLRDCRT